MRSREDSEEISLKHSGYAYVYTREGSLVAGGKWVRVAADLENLTLRLDNTHMTETNRDKYCKEMTITAGTTVLRAPQPGRPHCLALSDFNAASGKRRVLDCLTQEGVTAWFDLLTRVANTDLDTLLEPLREAREKRRDGGDLEDALRSAPAKVEVALLALRRGRLPADYVATPRAGRDGAARGAERRADVIGALVGLGAAANGPELGDSEKAFETPLLGAVRADALDAAGFAGVGADPTLADGGRGDALLCCARRGSAEIARALLRSLAKLAAGEADGDARSALLAHPDRRFGLHPETALEAAAVAGHGAVVMALAGGAFAKAEDGTRCTCRATATASDPLTKRRRSTSPRAGSAPSSRPSPPRAPSSTRRTATACRPGLRGARGPRRVRRRLAAARRGRGRVGAARRRGRQRQRARQLVAATRDLRASLGSAAFDASSAADVARSVRSVIRDGELPRNAGTALANFPADVCAAAPDDRFTALLRCCANGDGQGAELWLTLGADANHADHGPEKRTPLMACAARGDTHLAKMLLATGRCAVDARDALGCSALCRAAEAAARSHAVPVAARRRRPAGRKRPASRAPRPAPRDGPHARGGAPEASSVLRTLLGAPELAADAGLKRAGLKRRSGSRASLQKRDARGRTALFYAAEADRPENVELLLGLGRRSSAGSDAGAGGDALAEMLDVDATDDSGHTALRVATAAHAKGAVGALLRFGASASRPLDGPLASTPSGAERPKRPLSIALEAGDAQIAHTLGRFRASVLCGDEPATLRYVDRGNYVVDEPAGLRDGAVTALLVACRLGHGPAAKRLLDAGADPNRADAAGETPLLAGASGRTAAAARPCSSRRARGRPRTPRTTSRKPRGAGELDVVDDVQSARPGGRCDAAEVLKAILLHHGRSPVDLNRRCRVAANVRTAARTELTALGAAAAAGRRDAVLALLRVGADPDVAGDGRGRAPPRSPRRTAAPRRSTRPRGPRASPPSPRCSAAARSRRRHAAGRAPVGVCGEGAGGDGGDGDARPPGERRRAVERRRRPGRRRGRANREPRARAHRVRGADAAPRARRAAALLRRGCVPSPDGAGAAALLALAVDVGDDDLLALVLGGDAAKPSSGLLDAERPKGLAPGDARDHYGAALWAATGGDRRGRGGGHLEAPPLLSRRRAASARAARALRVLLDGPEGDDGAAADAVRRAVHAPAPAGGAPARSRRRSTPRRRGRVEALALLLRFAQGDQSLGALARDPHHRTPLHVAASHRAYDAAAAAVLVALHAGDDGARGRLLAAADAAGAAPLHRAARADDGAVASLLLGAGADSGARIWARTPRDSAAGQRAAPRRDARGHRRRRLRPRFETRGAGLLRHRRRGARRRDRARAPRAGDGVLEAALAATSPAAGPRRRTSTARWPPPPRNASRGRRRSCCGPTRPRGRGPRTARRCSASPSVWNSNLQPDFNVAVARRRHALAELLLLRGVEPLGPCDGALFDGADVLPRGDAAPVQSPDAPPPPPPQRATTPFFVAVETGDLDAVRIFLDQRVAVFDVDAPRPDGSTALMAALARATSPSRRSAPAAADAAPRTRWAGRRWSAPASTTRRPRPSCAPWPSPSTRPGPWRRAAGAARRTTRLTRPRSLAVAQRDAGAVAALLDAGADALAPIDGGPATPLLRACAPTSRRRGASWRRRGVDARHGANGTTCLQLALVHGHAAAATQLAAMSHAVMDGDFAECIRLHRNGNWPLDWTVGNDDLDDGGGLASSTRTEVIGELEPVEDVEELT
ncbi:hypothetical protein JL720_10489 [Aureococcus anophagefferens]|nr:hypothetical protein JL720_10489 [Aureococcus anophagefferens]